MPDHGYVGVYPTREEIEARPLLFKRETLAAVRQWKREHFDGQWAAKGREERLASLCALVDALDGGRRTVRVALGSFYHYLRGQQTVVLDEAHPSILSTIHEMGHHVRGVSELEACRYSVWMFRKVFPRQFERLTWDGHMLVRAPRPTE